MEKSNVPQDSFGRALAIARQELKHEQELLILKAFKPVTAEK